MQKRLLSMIALLLAIGVLSAPSPIQRIDVGLQNCTACDERGPSVSVYDENTRTDVVPPPVSHRTKSGFSLDLPAGYYRIWVRSARCNGERFLGVLSGRNRPFEISIYCPPQETEGGSKPRIIAFFRHVDAMYGVAGFVPPDVTSITMWDASDDTRVTSATISHGAYYFDEANCRQCVIEARMPGEKRARIALDIDAAPNFTLVRDDLTKMSIAAGLGVRGSPFDAPERLVEGPNGSIWILDRLGNRVDEISASGAFRQIEIPLAFSNPGMIVATLSYVWVSERNRGRVARFSDDGSVAEYDVGAGGGQPWRLRLAADANDRVWVIDGQRVATIDANGAVTPVAIPKNVALLTDIARGSDGRVWMSAVTSWSPASSSLLAIGPNGQIEASPIPSWGERLFATGKGLWLGGSDLAFVDGAGKLHDVALPIKRLWPEPYAVDPSGNVWFTDQYGDTIGSATPAGIVSMEYVGWGKSTGISDITLDSSGDVWVAERQERVVERYGKSIYFPPHGVSPTYLLFDSNGRLWYSDPKSDVIGIIGPDEKQVRCYALPLSTVRNCASAPPAVRISKGR